MGIGDGGWAMGMGDGGEFLSGGREFPSGGKGVELVQAWTARYRFLKVAFKGFHGLSCYSMSERASWGKEGMGIA